MGIRTRRIRQYCSGGTPSATSSSTTPSVSHRHLEVRCKRRQHRITFTDLSSVHETWVSGQRIPPNTLVELVAGDIPHLGAQRGSTGFTGFPSGRHLRWRICRHHLSRRLKFRMRPCTWVPISRPSWCRWTTRWRAGL